MTANNSLSLDDQNGDLTLYCAAEFALDSDERQYYEALVGDGARLTNDGTGLMSADGTRVYRYPKEKPNAPISVNPTGTQANFETYNINPVTGQKVKVGDGHLNIFKGN
ncbi:hypothetical protein [Dryocola boscaweniae]|uniref:hypothetical protein n=1 Tax=Dryocola boscaweniae TaxID=2925397 RepID=UPI003F69BFD3